VRCLVRDEFEDGSAGTRRTHLLPEEGVESHCINGQPAGPFRGTSLDSNDRGRCIIASLRTAQRPALEPTTCSFAALYTLRGSFQRRDCNIVCGAFTPVLPKRSLGLGHPVLGLEKPPFNGVGASVTMFAPTSSPTLAITPTTTWSGERANMQATLSTSPGLTDASATHNPSRLTTKEDKYPNHNFPGHDLPGRARGLRK